MSGTQNPPAGWTWSRFKAVAADVGSWTWGTVQGAFNEKASLSQILVDAVIGMIPLVGDATAVRDLIAVIIGMIDEEEKRSSKWQWILLVVLLFALIPVVGGVVKGAGRIIIKGAQEAAHLAAAAKMAHLVSGAKEVIEFLNRIGVKNAEKWILALRIADHQAALMQKFSYLISTMDRVLLKARNSVASMVPSLVKRIDSLRAGLKMLADKGRDMIPTAIKEFDQQLREIQAYIRSGGETTSRKALHEVASGQKVTTRAEERRLVEDGVLPVRNARGGFNQNPSNPMRSRWKKYYTHESGFPDMTYTKTDDMPSIAAYSGKMINRELRQGEDVFRFFGPEGNTLGVTIDESSAGGAWWGLGAPPKTAKEWREKAAVLDDFNRDGFLVTAKVGKPGPKAVVGTVSEQFSKKVPGQYLPGGATQAFFFLEKDFQAKLTALGKEVIKSNKPMTLVDAATGMHFTIKPTGWKDANGVWGYLKAPGTTTAQTSKLAAREQATKENREVVKHP